MQNELTSSLIKNLCKQRKITIKSMLEECDINRNFIYDLEKNPLLPLAIRLNESPTTSTVPLTTSLGVLTIPKLINKLLRGRHCQGLC